MIVVGVDPGPEQSAYVVWNGVMVRGHDIVKNDDMRHMLETIYADVAVFEQVESYGMPVGREVFDTVFETGRMWERACTSVSLMPRREVKLHLCGTSRAKDPNVRAALIDRFGGSRSVAIGTKKAPGPLYGVRSHEWSALALAVTYFDQQRSADG